MDCFNGKKWFDGHIQLWIAAVGQSLSGLWYTCVHAKQLLIDPMYMWVEKIIKILPIPETMQGISTSAESKEERNKKKKKKK